MYIQLTAEHWDTSVVTKTGNELKIRMAHSFPPPTLFLFLKKSDSFFKINMLFSNVFTINQKRRGGAAGKTANHKQESCVCVCVPLA